MQRILDGAAIGLSAACIAHCLAFPLFALALPWAGELVDTVLVHWAALAAASLFVLVALLPTASEQPVIPTLGFLGLACLLLGAIGLPTAPLETAFTVLGGALLASAHLWNWQRAHQRRCDKQAAGSQRKQDAEERQR